LWHTAISLKKISECLAVKHQFRGLGLGKSLAHQFRKDKRLIKLENYSCHAEIEFRFQFISLISYLMLMQTVIHTFTVFLNTQNHLTQLVPTHAIHVITKQTKYFTH